MVNEDSTSVEEVAANGFDSDFENRFPDGVPPACTTVCKHKCFLAKMFYQNIGPSSVHVFHMY